MTKIEYHIALYQAQWKRLQNAHRGANTAEGWHVIARHAGEMDSAELAVAMKQITALAKSYGPST